MQSLAKRTVRHGGVWRYTGENRGGGRMVPYTLVRSDRKTLALTIGRGGEVVVRAPHRLARWRIEAFLRKKEAWVLEQQARVVQWKPLVGTEGEILPYRGGVLTVTPAAVGCIQVEGESLLLPDGAGPAEIAQWLREQALGLLQENVAWRSGVMGLPPVIPRLTEARGRWGSCSGKNVVRLSWRLLLCPPEAMDYVVLHELCHIHHKNHGREFWAAVSAACPDWKRWRRWLRENQGVMDLL